MGSGKTAGGRELARRLNRRFVDTDSWIEKKAGASVADVFAKKGEKAFRALERQAVAKVSKTNNQVIALGGGAPCQPEIRRAVSRTGLTVRLTCRQAALWKRLASERGKRPLLQAKTAREAKARFAALLRGREAVYPKGDLRVSTTRLNARHAAERIAKVLARRVA
ncbi:MAG: shikimate kinase [Elusimicrobia bacterium]|nr:shikimate kinase [Elusimicrobiota bacterium]